MTKLLLNKKPLLYPIPIILVGTVIDNKPNFTTLGNCGIISIMPSVVYISIHKSHYSVKGITENQEFSINVPSAGLVDKVDFCGIYSGSKVDKSTVFDCFHKSSEKIPMIVDCPVNMECKVIKAFSVYDMEVFIGEIVETYINKDFVTNGIPDIEKISPLTYTMDNMYRSVGDIVANAYDTGKAHIKQNPG